MSLLISHKLILRGYLNAAPGTAPDDLTVRQQENNRRYLAISWQPPSLPNGRITNYRIYSNTDETQPLENWALDGK